MIASMTERNPKPFRRYLFPVVAIPFFLLLVFACLMNGHAVDFLWSPVSAALSIPLFAVILPVFALGFLAGALLTWLDK